MFAGLLPLLLQLPLLSVMYSLFRSAVIGGRPNGLLGQDLLGAPLGSHWLSGPGPLSVQGAVFVGLFALLAAALWLAARVARTAAARQAPTAPARTGQRGRAAQPAQPGGAVGVLARVVPYTTLAVAAFMPLAAGLYLLTTTAWAAAERAVFSRRARPDVPARSHSA